MAHVPAQHRNPRTARAFLLLPLTACLALGACADTKSLLPESATTLAASEDETKSPVNQTELQKATEYWGKEYAKTPSNKTAALSYARNLKALGEKQKALLVMQHASGLHGSDPEVAGEYGRLALDFDQLSVAQRMLDIADSPTRPDWKVISARGTVLAKQGQYKQAIPFYERALTLAPNQPSVLNNLALANAMSGEAGKAEGILRQASAAGNDAKIQQNLALVLGLQGKYDESKAAGSKTLAADAAASNTDLIRKMVRLAPKSPPEPGAFSTEVVSTAAAAPAMKPATIENQAPAGWQTDVAVNQPSSPDLKGSTR